MNSQEEADRLDVARILTQMRTQVTKVTDVDSEELAQGIKSAEGGPSRQKKTSEALDSSSKQLSNVNDDTSMSDGPQSPRLSQSPPVSRSFTSLRIAATAEPTSARVSNPIKQPFNLIDALCKNDDIMLYLSTQHLPPPTLLTLYSISKRFHWLVNSHYTSYMLCSARRWAPLNKPVSDATIPTRSNEYSPTDITTLLPFHNFVHLCTTDPTLRTTTARQTTTPQNVSLQPSSDPLVAQRRPPSSAQPPLYGQHSLTSQPTTSLTSLIPPRTHIRHVPTFRYLFFLVHRSRTVQSILAQLFLRGHRLPHHMPATLVKLWYTLDLPTTKLRASLFHNPRFWTNLDIRLLILFCIKLDMAFSDPLDGNGETYMRRMMLAQRTLTVLDDTLRRKACRTPLEMLRMWVQWKYVPREEHRGFSIMGVPPAEVGALQKEGWGRMESSLLRPDELALREAAGRRIPLQKQFVWMMTSGYINPATWEDYTSVDHR